MCAGRSWLTCNSPNNPRTIISEIPVERHVPSLGFVPSTHSGTRDNSGISKYRMIGWKCNLCMRPFQQILHRMDKDILWERSGERHTWETRILGELGGFTNASGWSDGAGKVIHWTSWKGNWKWFVCEWKIIFEEERRTRASCHTHCSSKITSRAF